MNKPLLSICIPTRNRAEYLRKSLDSLVSQIEFPQIEVIVLDNASTDGTQTVGVEYQEKFQNVFYHRNNEDISDRNFPSIAMLAHGTYRKLFNDTALFKPESLRFLLDIIQKYKKQRPVLFFLNNQTTPIKIKPETDCREFSRFCRITGHRLTWISSFGLWEEDCENLEAEFPICDTRLWQTYKTLQLASQKKQVILLEKEILTLQLVSNKVLLYGLYTVFYKNFPALLEPYIESGELSEKDLKFIKKDQFFTQALTWIFKTDKIYDACEYGDEVSFKDLILAEYRDEPYYKKFQRRNKIKQKYKSILFSFKESLEKSRFGQKLISLKRKIHLKLY